MVSYCLALMSLVRKMFGKFIVLFLFDNKKTSDLMREKLKHLSVAALEEGNALEHVDDVEGAGLDLLLLLQTDPHHHLIPCTLLLSSFPAPPMFIGVSLHLTALCQQLLQQIFI